MTSVGSATASTIPASIGTASGGDSPAGVPALPSDIKVVAAEPLAPTAGNSAAVPAEVTVALVVVQTGDNKKAVSPDSPPVSSETSVTAIAVSTANADATVVMVATSDKATTATLISSNDDGKTVVTSLPLPPSLTEQAAGLPVVLWEAQRLGTGNAVLDLDGGYRLLISQANNELSIFSARTNSTTRIWGDAQIDPATGKPLQFWGTMSFELATGAIITVRTAQNPDNPKCYQLDSVAVSHEARAIIIQNANSRSTQDLVIDASKKGWDVDDAFADGLLLLEQDKGWISEDQLAVTQELLNLTGIGGRLGPGKEMMSLREVVKVISSTFAQMAYFSSAQQRLSSTQNMASDQRRQDADRAAIEKAAIMKAMLQQEAHRQSLLEEQPVATR